MISRRGGSISCVFCFCAPSSQAPARRQLLLAPAFAHRSSIRWLKKIIFLLQGRRILSKTEDRRAATLKEDACAMARIILIAMGKRRSNSQSAGDDDGVRAGRARLPVCERRRRGRRHGDRFRTNEQAAWMVAFCRRCGGILPIWIGLIDRHRPLDFGTCTQAVPETLDGRSHHHVHIRHLRALSKTLATTIVMVFSLLVLLPVVLLLPLCPCLAGVLMS